ncbi:MAG: C-type lectin domain-containing protein [Methylovulum sp.]|nr:MAG: C-type lectin domain-containing protein [Methylovulum sp.]
MKRHPYPLKAAASTLLAAGALAATLLTTNAQAATQSPLYYSATTGNTYRAYYLEKGWPAASQNCTNKGGHLAVINNTSEWADTVAPLIGLDSTHDYWLGVTVSPAYGGEPVTVSGQAFYQLPYPYPQLSYSFTDNLTRYLNYSQPVQYWSFDINVTTKYYICEFEHAPI